MSVRLYGFYNIILIFRFRILWNPCCNFFFLILKIAAIRILRNSYKGMKAHVIIVGGFFIFIQIYLGPGGVHIHYFRIEDLRDKAKIQLTEISFF